jgi:two-component system response regulator (stage 0 sporulation protein F)
MKKILLVEDEEDIAAVLNMVLQAGGYQGECFTDPVLALKDFMAGSYDLVILDNKLPGMDGFELRRRLKKIDTDLRSVFSQQASCIMRNLGRN